MAVEVWQTKWKSYYRQKKYSSNTQSQYHQSPAAKRAEKVKEREEARERETVD